MKSCWWCGRPESEQTIKNAPVAVLGGELKLLCEECRGEEN